MSLKKILLTGMFGLVLMGGIQASPYQTPVTAEENENIVLVSTWCQKHPHRCHHHHPHYVMPEYRYHERFEEKARHCRLHPHSWNCERFCALNSRICYR